MNTLTIRLDEELERGLERLAMEQHRSKSELVRDILRRHTTSYLFNLAREELRPYGEKAGYLSDEDFFREFS